MCYRCLASDAGSWQKFSAGNLLLQFTFSVSAGNTGAVIVVHSDINAAKAQAKPTDAYH